MFGWSISATTHGSRLILSVPFPWLTALLSIPVMLTLFLLSMPTTGRKVAIRSGIGFLLYGLFLYSSKTTFDKTSNTVVIREFTFWHLKTTIFQLNTVDGVYVKTGDVVSQLRLQRTDGSVKSLSLNDQSFGSSKEKAAHAVNDFLADARPAP